MAKKKPQAKKVVPITTARASRKPLLVPQVPWQQEANAYIHRTLVKEAKLRMALQEMGWMAPEDAEAIREEVAKGKQHIRDMLELAARQQERLAALEARRPARKTPAKKAAAKKAAKKTTHH